MEELFQTPHLVQEDTALHSGSSSHLGTASQAENENDNVHASQVAHTAIYPFKSRSNCFSLLISNSMEGNKITGMESIYLST